MVNKFKSRKFIITWVTVLIIMGLQIVASLTKTQCDTAIITIASLVGSYNIANSIQKTKGGGYVEQ